MGTECAAPGWNNGPAYTGGPADGWYCELPENHDGVHSWGNDDADEDEVTWPVGSSDYPTREER